MRNLAAGSEKNRRNLTKNQWDDGCKGRVKELHLLASASRRDLGAIISSLPMDETPLVY
jgi:hypothetical protein